MREDLATGPVDQWIASVFDPSRRDQTIHLLARQPTLQVQPAAPRQRADRSITAEYAKKIARYNKPSTRGASPPVVAIWIVEAELVRVKIFEAALRQWRMEHRVERQAIDICG